MQIHVYDLSFVVNINIPAPEMGRIMSVNPFIIPWFLGSEHLALNGLYTVNKKIIPLD